MIALISIAQGIIERGLIYALVVMAVYITTRIIKFDDLSVEGSFGLGGAVTAACLTNGISLWITMPLTLLAGAVSGTATGLLHTKLALNNLISGIIVTTALFSVCLKIGSSNTIVPQAHTLFYYLPPLPLLLAIAAIVLIGLRWFLTTEMGFLLRALGSNPRMLTNIGKDSSTYKIMGIALSNMLTALAGSLLVQYVGYFSIWASVGILIIALTGLILAELLGNNAGINLLLGALAYQAIIAATFEFNIDQDWNKLMTAVLLVTLFAIKQSTASSTPQR